MPCLCWSEWNGVIRNWKPYLIPVQKFHMFALNRMNILFLWAWWHMATWNCMWIHLETINVVYFSMMILTVWSLACLLSWHSDQDVSMERLPTSCLASVYHGPRKILLLLAMTPPICGSISCSLAVCFSHFAVCWSYLVRILDLGRLGPRECMLFKFVVCTH